MRERDDGSVTLGNQSPDAVSSFLDFAYSGETIITNGNVDMLFQLASFLQVSDTTMTETYCTMQCIMLHVVLQPLVCSIVMARCPLCPELVVTS